MKSSPHSTKVPKERFKPKRCCTDIPCCILFIIFIGAFVLLSIFAFIEGDPKQLLHPTDTRGNMCGTGKFADKPYLYFFDWTKCIKPTNIIRSNPFVCPTPQVCVERCPSEISYYKLPNYHANRICTYDADASQSDETLVEEGKCATYIITSKPVFGRCLPEHLASLADQIIRVGNQTVYDSNGQPLNGSRLGKGAKYFIDLLNLIEVGGFLVEDLTTAWKHILVSFAMAGIASFIWIVLMRWLAKPIIWLGIILFFVILVVICGLSFMEFIQLRAKNDNQIVSEFKFVADANYYRSLPITWLIIGIIVAVLLIISALILMVVFKRLRIALAILTEASRAVGYNFLSLVWPFIPFLLELGVLAYWATVSVYLSTAGKPIYRVASNQTNNGDLCDPNKWINNGNNGECVFWEYGYNPQVNMDNVLNGTGRHFESFVKFINQNQWLPQFFSAFMFFWLTAFVIGFGQLVLAGVYARYYWERERFSAPCSSLIPSFVRALLYHPGTIAFGSLIIAIVKLIRAILEYFEKKVKGKTGRIARCLFCCCKCCLCCLEKFLKFLNRNAYIITAIYGSGFITSARRAFKIIISNPVRLLVIDKVCDFLIFLGKLCITGGVGVLAFFFFTGRIAGSEEYVPQLHYYFIPLLLIIIGTYIIATCFFSVYSMAVDTLFICALEDMRMKDKDPNHQVMMPKEFRKVFRVKKDY